MDVRITDGISRSGVQAIEEENETAPLFESRNATMIALLETVKRAATADTTILLTGESGTGKDVLARQIHRWSHRRDRPFVVINCATLADQLLENELFGHVRGAFAGAVNDKPGCLQAGDGGTVLIDAISELIPSLQVKFLSFVQECSFRRIGGSGTISVDVRLLAASNQDLEAEVRAGRFREDLYYRLNVIAFTLPPLRERVQDILPLAQRLLKIISFKAGRSQLTLSENAAATLTAYRWPGNLRELHNALEHAATLAPTDIITYHDLPNSVRHPAPPTFAPITHGPRLKDFEREHIMRVIAESPTLEQAAAKLGINVTTLWRKRREHGLG
jgi:NtrC-family two-component system response regulator AlgB